MIKIDIAEQISERVDIPRVTALQAVDTILNEMKDNGLLSIRRHRITILDSEELIARADLSGIM